MFACVFARFRVGDFASFVLICFVFGGGGNVIICVCPSKHSVVLKCNVYARVRVQLDCYNCICIYIARNLSYPILFLYSKQAVF